VTFQARVICLLEDVRVKFSDPKATFKVDGGWFHRFTDHL